jgi:hypothetical protein
MNASRQVVELVGDELEQFEPATLLALPVEPPEPLEEPPELLEELLELLEELPEPLEELPELLEELAGLTAFCTAGVELSLLAARNAAICITHQLAGLWVALAL